MAPRCQECFSWFKALALAAAVPPPRLTQPPPCCRPFPLRSDILHEMHQKGELKQALEGCKLADD